jgi:hypothetical protein
VIAFKFLASGAIGPFTGVAWPLPGPGPAPWVNAADERLDHGIHACLAEDLAFWLHDELWLAELDEPVARGHRHVIGSRGRLLRRIDGWDPDAARAFAEACAWRVRDRFVERLRAKGLPADAEQLSAVGRLRELRGVAEALRAAPEPAAAAGSYLVEALSTLDAGDAPVSTYIAARAAVAASGGDEAAFSREREEQGRLLARRLGIHREIERSRAP